MGVGDFSGFAYHIHMAVGRREVKSRGVREVGICLVPSFLTVISSRDHWYFDVLLGRTCFEVIWL